MNENNIIKKLEEYFKSVKNPVLKFINYDTNQTEIVVKGTPKEWEIFLKDFK